MLEIITHSKRKAKKEHVCSWCGGIIEKRETYDYQFIKYDCYVYSWKNHQRCRDIAFKLNMFYDVNNEGLTAEDFQDIIIEHYNYIVNNNNEKSSDFLTKLNVVYNHYFK